MSRSWFARATSALDTRREQFGELQKTSWLCNSFWLLRCLGAIPTKDGNDVTHHAVTLFQWTNTRSWCYIFILRGRCVPYQRPPHFFCFFVCYSTPTSEYPRAPPTLRYHNERKMSLNEKDEKMGRPSDTESQSSSERDLEFFVADGVDRAYRLKCDLINHCLQHEIGFGRYQLQLFFLTGFGWMADNIWLQGVAVLLGQVQQELLPVRVEFATLALYAGLIVGATVWGVMADLIGRKLSFNITLFLAGVFGIATGGAPNFVAFASFIACLGFGVGGNLPVDGALYLEHIPQSHQWTLTLLSAWWAVGQLVASVVAWGFIGNYSCAASTPVGHCLKADNMGWRYTCYTLGALTFIMFVMRFALFDLQESSKYLVAKGRDEEAIAVLRHIAARNGKTISLTLEQFSAVEGGKQYVPKSTFETIKGAFSSFSLSHVRPLFASRRLAVNSSITILLWGLLGLAYPLYNGFLPLYLKERVAGSTSSVSEAYRNYVIISVLGIPGSLIACAVVDWTRGGADGKGSRWALGGRKMTMAVSTALTGVFLFLFTTSRSEAAVLGFSCASGLTQNAMYGVLYAYTPEVRVPAPPCPFLVFPAPHRGTGDAIASSFNRVLGILAPVIKIATTSAAGTAMGGAGTANAPVFISASLFLLAAILMVFLPIETAGKAAL
ncbi:putative major facilitator superfamily protein [Lyophyllum shimeji]|uniref:Major facilitator superfamily protein n=1 Tax=Lyophyllum shimeji TaxID=47721 RepID=A0A9P3Q0T3_LYOSH|nr:putative major facilitator superfamily protein [Lyophyllum shimeji]